MDNFKLDIVAEGDKLLASAMDIAFRGGGHSTATHYAIRDAEPAVEEGYRKAPAKKKRLVFMWVEGGDDAIKLPFKLDAAGAADFARRWLAEADYGREPDHDGDNGKGWRLYNEGWGHVDGEYQGFIAVTPQWAMYGK